MNETNRTVIVLLAALWIVLMAIVIFVAWAADAETVARLDDFVRYLDDHRDNLSRLVVTLGALVLIVLSLLVIIVELAPDEEGREIRVEQSGATTIVPAEPLRLRLEEALTAMTTVTAARARVFSRDKGIGMKLDLTVTPGANIAVVTQEASRMVVETLQADLGLPVSAPPTVRIIFGPPKPEPEPAASSMTQPPAETPPAPGEPAPPPAAGPVAPAPGGPPPPPDAASGPATPTGYGAPAGPPQDAAAQGERPTEPSPPPVGPETPAPGEPSPPESPPRDEPPQH